MNVPTLVWVAITVGILLAAFLLLRYGLYRGRHRPPRRFSPKGLFVEDDGEDWPLLAEPFDDVIRNNQRG